MFRALLRDEVRLLQLKRRFRDADYICSPDVALGADIGRGVGIGKNVVVNADVEIGDFSYINCGAIVISGTVGKFCSIAHYSQIGAERHPTDHISTSPLVYGPQSVVATGLFVPEITQPPSIGHDVWIGSAAIVMQGVSVGTGAIVAAGAVVTKNVEPYAIVAGVPAKKIGMRFDDDVVERLLASQWWNHVDDPRLARAAISQDQWQKGFLPGEIPVPTGPAA